MVKEDGVLVIKAIRVTYHLRVGSDADRGTIERAHEHHARYCPIYRSIHPQIACTTTLVYEPLS